MRKGEGGGTGAGMKNENQFFQIKINDFCMYGVRKKKIQVTVKTDQLALVRIPPNSSGLKPQSFPCIQMQMYLGHYPSKLLRLADSFQLTVFLKPDEEKLVTHVLAVQSSDKARLMAKPNSRDTGYPGLTIPLNRNPQHNIRLSI